MKSSRTGSDANFQQATHGVGDGVSEWLSAVLQAVLGQPAFLIALGHGPFGIFYRGIQVNLLTGYVENAGQAPGGAGVVGIDLLASHRRAKLAPATVFIHDFNQPVGSPYSGLAVAFITFFFEGAYPAENDLTRY